MLRELQQHKRLLDYFPDFLKQYREYQVVTTLSQVELDAILERIDALFADLFVDTATLSGIEHREKMYGVIPEPNATLEERRFAVKMKETTSLPYTMRQYRETLHDLCGAENVEITLKANEYYLGIRIRAMQETGGENLAMLRSVNLLSRQMVPANMVYFAALFNHFEPSTAIYSAGAVSLMRKYRIQMSVESKGYGANETIYHGISTCNRIKQPIKEV